MEVLSELFLFAVAVVGVAMIAACCLLIRECRKLTRQLRKTTETYFPQENLKKIVDEPSDYYEIQTKVEIPKPWDDDRDPSS